MKKLITLSIAVLIMSCEKKKTNTVNNSGPCGGVDEVYTVTVNSNFERSYVVIENITDNVVVKGYNGTYTTKTCPITYTFSGNTCKDYRVYTYSNKNSNDTTLYMTDSGLTWNHLIVKKGTTVVYDKKDTVGYGNGYGSNRITSNEFKINY